MKQQLIQELVNELKKRNIEFEFINNFEDVGVIKVKDYKVSFIVGEDKYFCQFGSSKKSKNFVDILINGINDMYKHNIQVFWSKLGISVKRMQGRLVLDFATIVYKGKKLISIEHIKNYAKVSEFLQKYENLLKEEAKNVESK